MVNQKSTSSLRNASLAAVLVTALTFAMSTQANGANDKNLAPTGNKKAESGIKRDAPPGSKDKPAGVKDALINKKDASVNNKDASASKTLAPKMGYRLVMKVNYFGRIEWSVSPDGARLSSPLLSITCRPPLFETHLYNTETKKVKIFPQKAGYDRLSSMMEGGLTAQRAKYKYTPWRKDGDDVIAGRKCTKYSRNMLNAQQDSTRYAKYTEEYWVSPFFDLPSMDVLMAPLTRLTSREFKLQKGFGMRRVATWQVFRRGVKTPDVNDRLVLLDTLECKNTLIDPKIFEMGNNFTPVKDEGEILFSDDGGGFAGRF